MDRLEKIETAIRQYARIWKCESAAFRSDENVFLESAGTFFEIITFGANAVIRAHPRTADWCRGKFAAVPARDIMDGDNLFMLETKLREHRKKLSGGHIGYLLLSPEKAVEKPAGFEYAWYKDEAISAFDPRPGLDNTLAAVAYSRGRIAAMAGSDGYSGREMRQIGIDTLPEYRRRGLGAYLVKELALKIESAGKLACYHAGSANLASARLALGAGFYPVWMGYTAENI